MPQETMLDWVIPWCTFDTFSTFGCLVMAPYCHVSCACLVTSEKLERWAASKLISLMSSSDYTDQTSFFICCKFGKLYFITYHEIVLTFSQFRQFGGKVQWSWHMKLQLLIRRFKISPYDLFTHNGKNNWHQIYHVYINFETSFFVSLQIHSLHK